MMIPDDFLPELRRISASPVVERLAAHLRLRHTISVGIAADSAFWWIGAKQDFQHAACESWAELRLAEICDYHSRFAQSGGGAVVLALDGVVGGFAPIRYRGNIVAAVVLLHDAGMQLDDLRDAMMFWGEEIASLFALNAADVAGCRSAAMQQVAAQISSLASDRAPLLICGGPGCGKKYTARAIHLAGTSARSPYVVQRCSGLDDETLMSELFGYRRGAFAWAIQDKVGLLDVAAGGTLVIDEIGALSMQMQSRLLDFIEMHAIMAAGDVIPHAVDVRLIATSSMMPDELKHGRQLRYDLLEKLHCITIPPLSERREDIAELAESFFARRCMQLNRPVCRIPDAILDVYRRYRWPGNVSELRNEVERLAVMLPADGAFVPDLVNAYILDEVRESDNVTKAVENSAISVPRDMSIQDALIFVERRMIADALANNDGNRTKTAEMLGISRRNLIRKIESLGIG